jgi:hypothetical protein
MEVYLKISRGQKPWKYQAVVDAIQDSRGIRDFKLKCSSATSILFSSKITAKFYKNIPVTSARSA